MRLLKYLKEDWTIKSAGAVYKVYDKRWGVKGDEVILYVYDDTNKSLYWKIESEDEIVKNKFERTYNSKTEDHYGMLSRIGVLDIDINYGINWSHGIILKNVIYPYEYEESKVSQASFFAIRRYIKNNWWIK
jgi:hypothetical protein